MKMNQAIMKSRLQQLMLSLAKIDNIEEVLGNEEASEADKTAAVDAFFEASSLLLQKQNLKMKMEK